jgi:hypothetical protein
LKEAGEIIRGEKAAVEEDIADSESDVGTFYKKIKETQIKMESFVPGEEDKKVYSELLMDLKNDVTNHVFGRLYRHSGAYGYPVVKEASKFIMNRVYFFLGKMNKLVDLAIAYGEAKDREYEEKYAEWNGKHLTFSKAAIKRLRITLELKPESDFTDSLERNFFVDGRSREDLRSVMEFQSVAQMYSVLEHRNEDGHLKTLKEFLKKGRIGTLVELASAREYVMPDTPERREEEKPQLGQLQLDEKDSCIIEYVYGNRKATAKEIEDLIGFTRKNTVKRLARLVERKLLKRILRKEQFEPDVYELP